MNRYMAVESAFDGHPRVPAQRVVRERHFSVSGNYRLAPVGRMLIKTEANTDASSDQVDPKSLRDSA